MAYLTPDEIREFCGLTETECPDALAMKAEAYARGVIDDYCNTRFEDPGEDATYYFDGDGQTQLFAPDDHGPFASVTAIEYEADGKWVQYEGAYWLKAGGEWIELETPAIPGHFNWRVTGRCWTQLDASRQAMLKRASLMLCKLYLVPRDEPLGPSIRSISMEGISYTYQPVNEGNPTGVAEVDYLLRALRRNVVRT